MSEGVDEGAEGPPSRSAPGSLTASVTAGAAWVTTGRLTTQALQFLTGIALARILTPSDFGLLASVYVVSNFAAVFFTFGLGNALIHRTAPTEQDRSTVFWVTVISGAAFAGLMWAVAPTAARFFDMPGLVTLFPITGLTVILTWGVVHRAELQRQMRLRAVALADLTASAIGLGTMIALALLGAGPVSLAVGPVTTAGLASVFVTVLVRWRPRHFISRTSIRDLWGFSGGVLGFNFVNYWTTNTDNLLIGRVLGAAPLGLYNRAFNLMLLPVNQITGALGNVLFPALASIKNDLPRAGAGYLRTVRLITFVTAPVLVGMAAASAALVPFLWGNAWLGVVPMLQALSLAGVAQCVSVSTGWALQSQGRTKLMFGVGVVTGVFRVSGMVAGLSWGATGVAWGVTIASLVAAPIELAVVGRVLKLRGTASLHAVASNLSLAAVMGVLVWFLPPSIGLERSAASALAAQIGVGATIYVVGARFATRGAYQELRGIVRRR